MKRVFSSVLLSLSALILCAAPSLGQVQGELPREAPDDPPGVVAYPPVTSAPAAASVGGFQSMQVNVDIHGNNIVGDAANEPSIAVDPTDPSRIVIGWRQFDSITSNFREAGWAYSHDSGITWRSGTLDNGNFRSDPVLDFASDGTIYYDSLEGDFTTDLYRSETSGVSWLPPVPKGGGDKEWMAVDRTTGPGAGNLYFAWNTAAGCCGPNTFNRSIDGGDTYAPATQVGVIFGTLAVDPFGVLYVAGVQSSFSDTRVARSVDAELGVPAPTFVVNPAPLGGSMAFSSGPNPGGLLGHVDVETAPSVGPTAGQVYLLCSVDPPGPDPLDVHFIRSLDGGQTWSAPVRVNDDAPGTNAWQWFGTMSVAPTGRIDVIWNDTRNSPSASLSELHYSSSTDGGVTWTPNVAASPAFDHSLGYPQQNKLGDYYDMVSDDVGAHVAWAATFNGEQDVYYLRIGQQDCNGNGITDAFDILLGTSLDDDGNGVPDECEELVLSKISPGLTGQVNSIHVTRASPSGSVYLLLGTVPANLPIGPCPGEFLGMLNPVIVGPLTTDPTGHITLSGSVGPAISGATVLTQAIELATCNVSPTVSTTFP